MSGYGGILSLGRYKLNKNHSFLSKSLKPKGEARDPNSITVQITEITMLDASNTHKKSLGWGIREASKEGSPIEALQWGDGEKEQREEKWMASPAPGTWLLQCSAFHASLKTCGVSALMWHKSLTPVMGGKTACWPDSLSRLMSSRLRKKTANAK